MASETPAPAYSGTVRTVTAFVHRSPGLLFGGLIERVSLASAFLDACKAALSHQGFVVQTTRIIIEGSFPHWLPSWETLEGVPAIVKAAGEGRLLNFGRLTPSDFETFGLEKLAKACVELLRDFPTVSVSADLPYASFVDSDAAAKDTATAEIAALYAGIVLSLSKCRFFPSSTSSWSADLSGFANFQFAVSSNVPAFGPFFPTGYCEEKRRGDEKEEEEDRGEISFAIGLQHVDVCKRVLDAERGKTIEGEERKRGRLLRRYETALSSALSHHCQKIQSIVTAVEVPSSSLPPSPAGKTRPFFRGFDTSLAPCPGATSVVDLYRGLLVDLDLDESGDADKDESGSSSPFSPGGLEVSAMLTRALKGVKGVPLVGYCGLMLPPLEDDGLAGLAAEGRYGVRELLLHSAVCGIGLDTVPVPGPRLPSESNPNPNPSPDGDGDGDGDDGVMQEERRLKQAMARTFLDVAALSSRWGSKPLSVRLFPVPGMRKGDLTTFDSPYLTNTKVFGL